MNMFAQSCYKCPNRNGVESWECRTCEIKVPCCTPCYRKQRREDGDKICESCLFYSTLKREKKEIVHNIEQYTDDELRPILSQKYLKFLKTLGEITSEVVLGRLLELAVELDKSERITSKIEGRLSELQASPANKKVTISI